MAIVTLRVVLSDAPKDPSGVRNLPATKERLPVDSTAIKSHQAVENPKGGKTISRKAAKRLQAVEAPTMKVVDTREFHQKAKRVFKDYEESSQPRKTFLASLVRFEPKNHMEASRRMELVAATSGMNFRNEINDQVVKHGFVFMPGGSMDYIGDGAKQISVAVARKRRHMDFVGKVNRVARALVLHRIGQTRRPLDLRPRPNVMGYVFRFIHRPLLELQQLVLKKRADREAILKVADKLDDQLRELRDAVGKVQDSPVWGRVAAQRQRKRADQRNEERAEKNRLAKQLERSKRMHRNPKQSQIRSARGEYTDTDGVQYVLIQVPRVNWQDLPLIFRPNDAAKQAAMMYNEVVDWLRAHSVYAKRMFDLLSGKVAAIAVFTLLDKTRKLLIRVLTCRIFVTTLHSWVLSLMLQAVFEWYRPQLEAQVIQVTEARSEPIVTRDQLTSHGETTESGGTKLDHLIGLPCEVAVHEWFVMEDSPVGVVYWGKKPSESQIGSSHGEPTEEDDVPPPDFSARIRWQVNDDGQTITRFLETYDVMTERWFISARTMQLDLCEYSPILPPSYGYGNSVMNAHPDVNADGLPSGHTPRAIGRMRYVESEDSLSVHSQPPYHANVQVMPVGSAQRGTSYLMMTPENAAILPEGMTREAIIEATSEFGVETPATEIVAISRHESNAEFDLIEAEMARAPDERQSIDFSAGPFYLFDPTSESETEDQVPENGMGPRQNAHIFEGPGQGGVRGPGSILDCNGMRWVWDPTNPRMAVVKPGPGTTYFKILGQPLPWRPHGQYACVVVL